MTGPRATARRLGDLPGSETAWLVLVGKAAVGLVTRPHSTATDTHAYRAYLGLGEMSKLVGHTYDGLKTAVAMVGTAAAAAGG